MATLWQDRKPCEFLMQSGASAFKIIQTSKGRRKLVGYFENWETTLKALDSPPVTLPSVEGSICSEEGKETLEEQGLGQGQPSGFSRNFVFVT
ncbi:unnamed protein product [Rhizophagus irregularis]|nr:unnamed protein product [Rhizophagus irregularis]